MSMVCLCMAVNDRKVRRAIRQGASTVAEVGAACGAGTVCTGCHPTIEDELDEAAVTVRGSRHLGAATV